MSEPFLAEVKLVSFGFPPKGWAQCNGQLLPINQNQALFSLLGTTYGGDDVSLLHCPICVGACLCILDKAFYSEKRQDRRITH